MGRCRGWKIPSLFILESNVVRLSPSLEAAPWGPPIIPAAARNVCKIRAASRSRNLPREATGGIVFACDVEKGLGRTPLSDRMTERSIRFLEFPYITGPIVCNECIHRCLRYLFNALPHAPGEERSRTAHASPEQVSNCGDAKNDFECLASTGATTPGQVSKLEARNGNTRFEKTIGQARLSERKNS
jgi:hypothetical protein